MGGLGKAWRGKADVLSVHRSSLRVTRELPLALVVKKKRKSGATNKADVGI